MARTRPSLHPHKRNRNVLVTFVLIVVIAIILVVNQYLLHGSYKRLKDAGEEDGGQTPRQHYLERDNTTGEGDRKPSSGVQVDFWSNSKGAGAGTERLKTLVIYVLLQNSAPHRGNFQFFLRQGVFKKEDLEYIIVVVKSDKQKKDEKELQLPDLPPNAVYKKYSGCSNFWGAVQWALLGVQEVEYSYFILLNSEARGPFVPPYLRNQVLWTDILSSRLTKTVKLVGPTISCSGCFSGGNASKAWHSNPHVQSTVLATDQTGLQLLRKAGSVLKCHDNEWDERISSELGSSLSIISAGYNIDCLMLRYQGIDWRDKKQWNCNLGLDPVGENRYDGISVHPYEVLFTPLSQGLLDSDWSFVKAATKYSEWANKLDDGEDLDTQSNMWLSDTWGSRGPSVLYMNARGPGCFDNHYYRDNNPDLAHIQDSMKLWEHFLTLGQFQGRPYRFSCEVQLPSNLHVAYMKARGFACFDFDTYYKQNKDLKFHDTYNKLWEHFTLMGQFEGRPHRFLCDDLTALQNPFETNYMVAKTAAKP